MAAPVAKRARVEIYGLYDETGLRYIGKANNSSARLKSHLRDCRRRKTPVYNWINKLLRAGKLPRLEVLEVVTDGDWRDVERRLIAEHRAAGTRLMNVADGGDEPFCPPELRRENGRKVSQARCDTPAKKRLWQIKMQLSHALRRGEVNNKTRQGMRDAAVKHPHLFGLWANLPDRVEDAHGSAV